MLGNFKDSPLTNPDEIRDRLDCVEFFFNNKMITDEVQAVLSECADLERCLQRIQVRRGSPRDLSSIGKTLIEIEKLNVSERIFFVSETARLI